MLLLNVGLGALLSEEPVQPRDGKSIEGVEHVPTQERDCRHMISRTTHPTDSEDLAGMMEKNPVLVPSHDPSQLTVAVLCGFHLRIVARKTSINGTPAGDNCPAAMKPSETKPTKNSSCH